MVIPLIVRHMTMANLRRLAGRRRPRALVQWQAPSASLVPVDQQTPSRRRVRRRGRQGQRLERIAASVARTSPAGALRGRRHARHHHRGRVADELVPCGHRAAGRGAGMVAVGALLLECQPHLWLRACPVAGACRSRHDHDGEPFHEACDVAMRRRPDRDPERDRHGMVRAVRRRLSASLEERGAGAAAAGQGRAHGLLA